MKTLCIVCALAAFAPGCGGMKVGEYRVRSASIRATALASYPHVPFEDREAYLLGSTWYYRDPTYGVVVFEDEPPELRAFRERVYAAEPGAPK